jgi:F-type H+-transporting ATPase subunit beta
MTYITPDLTQALGRVLGPSGEPRDGGAPLELPARLSEPQAHQKSASDQDEMLPTGIKVIDLFAPIVRGGLFTMIGGSGIGKVVATSEIVHNLAERQRGCGVFVVHANQHYSLIELLGDLRAGGVDESIAIISVQQDEPPDQYQRAIQTGAAIAQGLAISGHEVLFGIDEPLLTAPIKTFYTGLRAVTTLVWQFKKIDGDIELPDNQLLRGQDGRIVFNNILGRNSIWPAVDPVRSGSRLLDEHRVGAAHRQVAQSARELLRQHEALLGGTESDAALGARARRLARPGVWVAIEQTIAGYKALFDGHHDQRPEEDLRFLGALPD